MKSSKISKLGLYSDAFNFGREASSTASEIALNRSLTRCNAAVTLRQQRYLLAVHPLNVPSQPPPLRVAEVYEVRDVFTRPRPNAFVSQELECQSASQARTKERVNRDA